VLSAVTIPPAEDEVARAAAAVSDGALADVRVERFPRCTEHHAYLLRASRGAAYLFKVHRRPHFGRMRRLIRIAEILAEHEVPHPRLRWHDLDRRTLEVPYIIQDFLPGEDGAHAGGDLSFADQHRVGASLGAAFRQVHDIEYVDTPTSWATEFDDRFRTRAAECVALDALDKREHDAALDYYDERRGALADVPRRLSHDDPSPKNLLIERRSDGWHFGGILDFDRARGRDPLLDVARLRATAFARWPAAAAAFMNAYGAMEPDGPGVRDRAELYELYIRLADVTRYRESEEPERETAAREALREWLTRS